MIRYDDIFYPTRNEKADGGIQLLESRIVPDVVDAWTDRGFQLRVGDSPVFNDLPPTYLITSTLADCSGVTLNAPKPVQIAQMASA